MLEDEKIVREFLLESAENLERLDRDLVTLESDPRSAENLASAFRTLHTLKGTCGFLGFDRLERLAHRGESLLIRLRDGELWMSPGIATVLLAMADAIRSALQHIERTGVESDADHSALIEALECAAESPSAEPRGHDAVRTSPEGAGSAIVRSTIRVDVPLLERIGNQIGELVLTRNQILASAAGGNEALQGAARRLDAVTSELQEGILRARMQPIQTLWDSLPRLVRDAAMECGKTVRLEIEGGETELDRTLLEAVKDPLLHLIRNAIDHGIEPPDVRRAAGKPPEGTLRVRARPRGGRVHVEVEDDGVGISVERVRERALERGLVSAGEAQRMSDRAWMALLFRPGFSTAERVTTLSGRGVGLDVVKTNVERIGGTLELETRPTRGTTFRLRIPLTLAILPVLLVTSRGEEYAIPLAGVTEVVRIGRGPNGGIEWIEDVPVRRLRGSLLRVVFLARALGDGSPSAIEAEDRPLVIAHVEGRRLGLAVDSIREVGEIVVKPLHDLLRSIPVFAGATITGEGRICPILDLLALAKWAGVPREESGDAPAVPARERGAERAKLVLVEAGGMRAALPLSGILRLERAPRSAIERVGTLQTLARAGRVVPVAPLSLLMDAPDRGEPEDPACVVVPFRGGEAGLLVDRVVDVAEGPRAHPADARGGSFDAAVVDGQTVAWLDPERLMERAEELRLLLRVRDQDAAS